MEKPCWSMNGLGRLKHTLIWSHLSCQQNSSGSGMEKIEQWTFGRNSWNHFPSNAQRVPTWHRCTKLALLVQPLIRMALLPNTEFYMRERSWQCSLEYQWKSLLHLYWKQSSNINCDGRPKCFGGWRGSQNASTNLPQSLYACTKMRGNAVVLSYVPNWACSNGNWNWRFSSRSTW